MKSIENEVQLDELLSVPSSRLVEMMKRLDGDIMILGIAGKMGVTLGRMAKNAIEKAGVSKKVFGVSRFSNPDARKKLEEWGIETISCDLLDQNSVELLPTVPNIIYMAGRKFGTDGSEELTWAMNVTAPGYVARHFKDSRIVAFSTGCVYPLTPVEACGCTEACTPASVGEYAQSCLGRERVFGHFCKENKTPTLLLRLNYAVDLRYGVLHDIGMNVWEGKPVSKSVGHFNVLWQGDANNYALLALEHCGVPAVPLNITGPETIPVNQISEHFAKVMGKKVKYEGEPGGTAYLNNAAKAFDLFGYPEVSLSRMIECQAEWIMQGGSSLGKPTHFEVNDGKF